MGKNTVPKKRRRKTGNVKIDIRKQPVLQVRVNRRAMPCQNND